jgi:hypothetical protein
MVALSLAASRFGALIETRDSGFFTAWRVIAEYPKTQNHL